VSLWSRDQLRIALTPHGLALLRHQGNPLKPVASKSIACDARDWHSLLPLLERELSEPAWRAPQVHVVLSNQYVRYVLTAPPGKALTREEEQALVGASFREIYGNEVADWRIRVDSQPPQFGLVGAAIDESLAALLGELFKRHHYGNWTLNPLASLASHHPVPQTANWWVLVEPGWMCLFNTARNYWRYVSSQPVDEHWRNTLPNMLDREARMTGHHATDTIQTAFIQAVGVGHGVPPVTSGWNWRMARQTSPEQGALALAAA
jgi:hypothetical protein